jgi:AcrR family transcriptional regulator
MPKIIDNARENLLTAAEELLFDEGYKGVTIRKVAKRCGMAAGTVFNYFENKDMLIASVIARDWAKVLQRINEECRTAKSVSEGLCAVFNGIRSFSEKYKPVWADYTGSFFGFFRRHRLTLRRQIEELLRSLLLRFDIKKESSFFSILSETVLSSAVQEDIRWEDLLSFVSALFPSEISMMKGDFYE